MNFVISFLLVFFRRNEFIVFSFKKSLKWKLVSGIFLNKEGPKLIRFLLNASATFLG